MQDSKTGRWTTAVIQPFIKTGANYQSLTARRSGNPQLLCDCCSKRCQSVCPARSSHRHIAGVCVCLGRTTGTLHQVAEHDTKPGSRRSPSERLWPNIVSNSGSVSRPPSLQEGSKQLASARGNAHGYGRAAWSVQNLVERTSNKGNAITQCSTCRPKPVTTMMVHHAPTE